MADCYVKSAKARVHEFQTDTGLFKNVCQVQFKFLFIELFFFLFR